MAEYIAGKDSEIVRITGCDSNEDCMKYTIEGKSCLPFNIDVIELRKVNVPDVGKIPSKAAICDDSHYRDNLLLSIVHDSFCY
eukprot:15363545-Ditylum_brightwellii.AAC.1